jgi:hypothetical protein
MKRGEIRYCACDCGLPAKKVYSGDRFKSWRSYALGHAPNERLEIRTPTDPGDLGYAAGIIDGEGCIYARVRTDKDGSIQTFLQLQIIMCSETVVGWFAQQFGGDVRIDQPRSLNNRLRFCWQIRGRQVGTILIALLPHLKEKKQRAELAIELSKLLGQSRPGNGQKVPDIEMIRRRELASSIKAFNQNLRSEDAVQ